MSKQPADLPPFSDRAQRGSQLVTEIHGTTAWDFLATSQTKTADYVRFEFALDTMLAGRHYFVHESSRTRISEHQILAYANR